MLKGIVCVVLQVYKSKRPIKTEYKTSLRIKNLSEFALQCVANLNSFYNIIKSSLGQYKSTRTNSKTSHSLHCFNSTAFLKLVQVKNDKNTQKMYISPV